MDSKAKIAVVATVVIVVFAAVAIYVTDNIGAEKDKSIMPQGSVGSGDNRMIAYGILTFEDGEKELFECYAFVRPLFRVGEDMFVEIAFQFNGTIFLGNIQYLADPVTLMPRDAVDLDEKDRVTSMHLFEYTDPTSGAEMIFKAYTEAYMDPVFVEFTYKNSLMHPSFSDKWEPCDFELRAAFMNTTFKEVNYKEGKQVGNEDIIQMTGTIKTTTKSNSEPVTREVTGEVILRTLSHNATKGANDLYSIYREMIVMIDTENGQEEYLHILIPCNSKGILCTNTHKHEQDGVTYTGHWYTPHGWYFDQNNTWHNQSCSIVMYNDDADKNLKFISLIGANNIGELDAKGNVLWYTNDEFEMTAKL